MNEYVELSHQAVARAPTDCDDRPIDLVVWPETMFRSALRTFDPGYQLPPDVGADHRLKSPPLGRTTWPTWSHDSARRCWSASTASIT